MPISIEALKLTQIDMWLIILSPICAVIGSVTHMCLIEMNPHKMPGRGQTILLNRIDVLGRLKWVISRLVIGGVLGLLFAFYFVGAINENSTSLFKLLAFAILVGYSAPRLWFMQEKILLDQIDSKIRAALHSSVRPSLATETQQEDTPDRNAAR